MHWHWHAAAARAHAATCHGCRSPTSFCPLLHFRRSSRVDELRCAATGCYGDVHGGWRAQRLGRQRWRRLAHSRARDSATTCSATAWSLSARAARRNTPGFLSVGSLPLYLSEYLVRACPTVTLHPLPRARNKSSTVWIVPGSIQKVGVQKVEVAATKHAHCEAPLDPDRVRPTPHRKDQHTCRRLTCTSSTSSTSRAPLDALSASSRAVWLA